MQDAGHQTPEEDPAPIKTVLLVEDDVDIRDGLTIILRDATPYQVIPVADGFAALKVVRTRAPHLLVFDYLLPGMDGLECLDLLRESKGMEQTPAILMSAAPPKQVQDRTDLFFLEKPFEMDTFLNLTKQLLEES